MWLSTDNLVAIGNWAGLAWHPAPIRSERLSFGFTHVGFPDDDGTPEES